MAPALPSCVAPHSAAIPSLISQRSFHAHFVFHRARRGSRAAGTRSHASHRDGPATVTSSLRAPLGGAFLPTGSHKSSLKNGFSMGAQGAYSFNEHFAAVGTFAWARSVEHSAIEPQVNVFQYDVGAEASVSKQVTSRFTLRPFLGIGLGGRAYDYDDHDSDAQYNVAGYGAGGAQLEMGRIGWRLEVRNYVSGFKGMSGELDSRQTRNDLMISHGFIVRF
jgi:hypothetical protein